MRHLSIAQIKVLKQYPKARDVEDLPNGVFEKLEEMNDYETLWQDVNRFLWDQLFEDRGRC